MRGPTDDGVGLEMYKKRKLFQKQKNNNKTALALRAAF